MRVVTLAMSRSRLPLAVRLPLHGAQRALRTTRTVADLGLVALDLVGQALGDEPASGSARRASEPPPAPAPARAPVDVSYEDAEGNLVYIDPGNGHGPDIGAVADEPPPTTEEIERDLGFVDDHIDEETELVDEVADPGAQDGAGAAIHVEAPFDGYDSLRAADVVARLPGSDAATLAAIELYEQTHRQRRTVLDAVAREARRRG